MTIEEVKIYFKDAKVVECLSDNVREDITKDILRDVYIDKSSDDYWVETKEEVVKLYSKSDGFAKIIEYKDVHLGMSNTPIDCVEKQPYSAINKHYKVADFDVIDISRAFNLNFCMSNIVKYACRSKNDDINDLKKIIDYAQRELKHLEK